MNAPDFVHLRIHSEFSITDGIVRIDELVEAAHADGQPAVALTDLANVFGMVKFYKSARSKGLKPIIGADVWVENPDDLKSPHRLLILCRNKQGYLTLADWLTRAHRENQHFERALIKLDWFTQGDTSGLVVLSGAQLGDVGSSILNGDMEKAAQLALFWARTFPGSYFLEIQRTGNETAELALQGALHLAEDLNLPVVATHPVQFMQKEDFKAHEARVCIAEGYVLADKRRPKPFTDEQYFKSRAEMRELFADIPEAIANTIEIAKRCNVTIQLGKNFLPLFPTPDGMTLDDFLVHSAKLGLEERMVFLYPDAAEREKHLPTYRERLKFETDTIVQMGFPGYFLIVADFINWAKKNGCPVGPGRGSGAGSLVAFSLGITDIDPLRYALLFERFLNPERVSMPDFDVDFCQDNRWRVIEYVRETYGVDAVSQIITFGTMAAKAVVRDVGRVLDFSYTFCDQVSKLIPAAPGKQYSLDDAVEMEPILKQRLENEEELRELWELAQKLEGMTRNIGMHAGGVLIAPGKLTDFCPLYQAPGEDSSPVSQFDKDDVEQVGLVKFDFLGLRNLTIIELAMQYIKRLDPTSNLVLDVRDFDDPAAYQVLKDANTTAIFQVESDGMKKLLKKLAPDRFEDIIAVLALYRPGPLGSGMVDDFILRKKGQQKIEYFLDDLKACLDPTYGVIVYQEQVMQISQIVGGYTLGAADMLRRAMGKKKPEEMAQHKGIFMAGAEKKGYDVKIAEHLFDLMAKFAEYGFNKSHTAAYAVVSYQTAWLKAHHTAAFMAATMSSELDNTDQLKIFYDDCLAQKRNPLTILPPDINHSFYRFVPVSRKEIRYALGAIKGTGEAAVEHIVAERERNGPFKDLFDFCRRTDKRTVNKRTVETLVRAGAFDSLNDHRASLLASVEKAMAIAENEAANAHQVSLFDLMDTQPEHEPAVLVETGRWDIRERLAQEKLAIGFYYSGHLFDSWKADVRALVKKPLSRIEASREPQLLAGVITALRTKVGNRGKMAFITLDDNSGQPLDVAIYSELFDAARGLLREDDLLIIKGKVSKDEYNGGDGLRVVADQVFDLIALRTEMALNLKLELEAGLESHVLKSLLQPYRVDDGCPVEVRYQQKDAKIRLLLGDSWRVRLDDGLLNALKSAAVSASIQYPER